MNKQKTDEPIENGKLNVEIDYLPNQLWALPTLIDWHFAAWASGCPESAKAAIAKAYLNEKNIDQIPLTLVAYSNKTLFGSATLVISDLPTRPELSPWLAAVYVTPEYRNQKIGSLLSRSIVEEAKKLGLKEMYLLTGVDSRVEFYKKLGWEVFSVESYANKDWTVMKHIL